MSCRWTLKFLDFRTAGTRMLCARRGTSSFLADWSFGPSTRPTFSKQDYLASHDMEDFIAVVDGRSSLIPEVDMTSPSLKIYIADAVRTLLGESRFLDALPGYLMPDDASQARI